MQHDIQENMAGAKRVQQPIKYQQYLAHPGVASMAVVVAHNLLVGFSS
jgi:hypothetical protein